MSNIFLVILKNWIELDIQIYKLFEKKINIIFVF